MQTLWQDLRYGFRTLQRNFAFTAVAVIALTLGIGANTAIFSVVNSVLLRPLPYAEADRIVAIQELGKEGNRVQVTPANFLDWRAQNTVFEHLAAILTRPANLADESTAERINLAMTSANFFSVFGVQPQRGRFFFPEDEQAGHAPIAVISNGLWLRRFGGDPEMVGKAITLDGTAYTVVGIAPAGFQYPDQTEVWLPPFRLAPALSSRMDVTQVRGFGFLSAVALLKENVSVEAAHAEMETLTARLREQYPQTNNNRFNRVVSLHTHLVGDTQLLLMLLLGAVGFVLLIACANVANLLLARAAARQKEMAIRAALGASRWRVLRQLLTESLLLAFAAGSFGVLLAWWSVDLLIRFLPKDFPRRHDINLDFTVLGFTLLVSAATGVLFGFAPAWQVSRLDVNESLKESGRGAAGSDSRKRLRRLLVVSEVALSLVLLIGAGLLFRSFLRLQAVNKGFDSDQVLTLRLNPSGTNFQQDLQFIAYYQQVEDRLRALPGVEAVGAINTLPLSKGPTFGFQVEGRPPLPPDQWPGANYRNVTPDYFRALDIPILQGRAFEARDHANAPPVAVINEATAARDFAGENPVGKRLNFGGRDAQGQPIWFEIIGVVGNVRSLELNTEPTPEVFTATLQDAFGGMSVVIRTHIEPENLIAAVRQTAQEVDRAQPVTELRTFNHIVSDAVTQPRFNLALLIVFGGLALILSAAGIYGVTSYGVTQRTQEIGIRMALGAQTGDVLKMIVSQSMRLTVIGIGIGLLAAFFVSRLLSGLLFDVSGNDPLTYVSVSVILAGVALIACFVPARRAAKVDPIVALRYE